MTQRNPYPYVRVMLGLKPMAQVDSHRRLALVNAPLPTAWREEPKADEQPGTLMQVGELAKATGKTVRAIHLYEDLGLLKPHERSKGRYRLFNHDALVRVRWISKLQSLGFSLSEIQEVARAQEGSDSAKFAAARLREVYLEKLADTRAKISELAALETELMESLAYLDSCKTSCEPQVTVHSCPSCDRHDQTLPPPDLVAGAQQNPMTRP
jgi:MerR family transcriptional regulator, copper efflux regulator